MSARLLTLLGGQLDAEELHYVGPQSGCPYVRRRAGTKLGKATTLTEKLYFFPDLNQAGEYRGTLNFGAVTKMNKWLGWQNPFGDIYVTNPPAGKKQNDIGADDGIERVIHALRADKEKSTPPRSLAS